jgi:hypothetical protein
MKFAILAFFALAVFITIYLTASWWNKSKNKSCCDKKEPDTKPEQTPETKKE